MTSNISEFKQFLSDIDPNLSYTINYLPPNGTVKITQNDDDICRFTIEYPKTMYGKITARGIIQQKNKEATYVVAQVVSGLIKKNIVKKISHNENIVSNVLFFKQQDIKLLTVKKIKTLTLQNENVNKGLSMFCNIQGVQGEQNNSNEPSISVDEEETVQQFLSIRMILGVQVKRTIHQSSLGVTVQHHDNRKTYQIQDMKERIESRKIDWE